MCAESFLPLKKNVKSIVKISNKHKFIEIYLLQLLLSFCPRAYGSKVLDLEVKAWILYYYRTQYNACRCQKSIIILSRSQYILSISRMLL